MRASGPYGELRVSYQHAARLGPWTIEQEQGTFVFRSTVTEEHQHWIRQRPLDLVLQVGNVDWVWRGVELERDGSNVSLPLVERPIVETRHGSTVAERRTASWASGR